MYVSKTAYLNELFPQVFHRTHACVSMPSVPESAHDRAKFFTSLKPKKEGDECSKILRAAVLRDVSWRVRASAAAHPFLSTAVLRAVARDPNVRVRRVAIRMLAQRTDSEFLAKIVGLEPCAQTALAALSGGNVNSNAGVAEVLLEHDDPVVRAEAVKYCTPPDKARCLLADERSIVREAARNRIIGEGVALGERDVRRFRADSAFEALIAAKLGTMRAFAAAVEGLEEAGNSEGLQALVGSHIRFARAFNLSRKPEDRLWIKFE